MESSDGNDFDVWSGGFAMSGSSEAEYDVAVETDSEAFKVELVAESSVSGMVSSLGDGARGISFEAADVPRFLVLMV